MNRQKQKTVVPKLRFPEFRDAGPWEVKRLGEVGKIITGKTPKTNDDSLWNGDIAFVTPTDINDEVKYQRTSERSVVKQAKMKVLPIGSIAYTCIASIGKIALTAVPCITNQQINSIIVNNNFYNEFIYYSLLRATPTIKAMQANNAMPIINKNEFSLFTIPTPKKLEEQQKIADCLSSLDELIELQTQKLDALKAHKKGLMQQLFPAEGETVPRLRLPEFRDTGPWTRYRFGELLTLEYGSSLPEESRLDGSIPVVGSNGVVGFHKEALISGPVIIIGRKGSVGEVNWIESDCYPIDTTFYVKMKSPNCQLFFVKLLLENSHLPSLSDNGTVPGLNRNDVYVLKTALPRESEQQKIAECLSSIDELIELQSQKLEALKAHKKGLMQQLFPQEMA
ncbi:restriction endonuclease subunit S [Desulfohalobiaceae bacterium Ax17]|uniref:restriction endonuclease subunit S n=1 Tax=Desulfovulcanus ferrireducens TaxID=2831190 RepID=UPI00207BAD50|nr:restriction endonuclease subunit S [Desulfovulcanus ferrireducens]MBT8763093.1 restriction endonuclease subunit S [Desulfovulcanus ferrireducens]